MGEAFLDYKKGGSGLNINGIIKDYYAAAGEKVEVGDFVEFVNGIAGKTTETSTLTKTSGVAYYDISACKLSKNKVFIASNNYGQYLYGTVCTIEGATITAGTTTQLNSSSATGVGLSVVALDENRVFVAHSINSSYIYLQGTVCTVDGTAITVQMTKQLMADTYTGYTISAQLLPSGKIFIAHSLNTSSGYTYLYGTIVTVSATSMSRDNTFQLVDTASHSPDTISTCLVNDNTVFISYDYGTGYVLHGIVCTISGTTLSKGTDVALSSTNYSGSSSVALLEENKVFVANARKSRDYYHLYGMVCTISGTSISSGGSLKLAGNSCNSGSTVAISNEKVFVAYGNGSYLCGIVCKIDGTAITAGTATSLNTNEYTGHLISALLLEDNVFIGHSYNKSNRYLYAQMYGVDEENLLPTTTVSIKEYETQVRPATSLPCNGVASTSGEGGDDTGHKDIVSVYTVEQTLASLPVGTLVKDTSSTFLGEPVIWKIADVNHEGYPSNSVTLISDKILALRCFDAKEPNNSNSRRQTEGNNRYSVSNIRQWLNSDVEAGMWYSAQHSADTPPNSTYVYNGINPYDTNAGFLNGFSQKFKDALLETTLPVTLTTIDGGGTENVIDKMFLASCTEVGKTIGNGVEAGTLLSIFNDGTNRIASVTAEGIADSNYSSNPANENTAWKWWLRTPDMDGYYGWVHNVSDTGALERDVANYGYKGVRPLCNLPSSIKVSKDEDGIYELIFN